jgi:hypothetical protein
VTDAWQQAYLREAWAVLIEPEGWLLLSWLAMAILVIAVMDRW